MVEKTRISVRYDIAQALREGNVLPPPPHPAKRLRRMPHLFSRLLELPVDADSFVQVQEEPSAFTFKVTLPLPLLELDAIHTEIIHVVPGATKVCIAGAQIVTAHLEELDIPLWRFRLPPSSLPEAATAACDGHGLLVLTVPKSLTFQEVSTSDRHPDQVNLLSASSVSVDLDPTAHVDGPPQESASISAVSDILKEET